MILHSLQIDAAEKIIATILHGEEGKNRESLLLLLSLRALQDMIKEGFIETHPQSSLNKEFSDNPVDEICSSKQEDVFVQRLLISWKIMKTRKAS